MADTFRIERTNLVGAPPGAIHPLVADFHRWREWSPYEDLDPDLKRTYSGAEKGVGAVYAWEGNGKAGAGRMEIVEAPVPDRVTIRLDFSRPMRASHEAVFTFIPEGGATRVTWAMTGARPLLMKLMGLFVNFDRMIGRDFEKGLAKLKAAAETTTA